MNTLHRTSWVCQCGLFDNVVEYIIYHQYCYIQISSDILIPNPIHYCYAANPSQHFSNLLLFIPSCYYSNKTNNSLKYMYEHRNHCDWKHSRWLHVHKKQHKHTNMHSEPKWSFISYKRFKCLQNNVSYRSIYSAPKKCYLFYKNCVMYYDYFCIYFVTMSITVFGLRFVYLLTVYVLC